MLVIVAYEGVLVTRTEQPAPIQAGVDIIRSLTMAGRVLIMAEEASLEKVETFCGVHRINDIGDIKCGTERPGTGPILQRQIDEVRSAGNHVDSVVLGDASMLGWLLKNRLAAMLFMAPEVTPPQERPDDSAGKSTWEQITQDLEERERKKKVSVK